MIARRIDHHPEEERIKDQGQARLEETTVETVKDDLDHASRVGSYPQLPKKPFTQDFMGSKNPKTSYSQKYYLFCQIIP